MFWRRRSDDDFSSEIQSHLDLRARPHHRLRQRFECDAREGVGTLRRARLYAEPADPGDWHTHGARGDGRRRRADGDGAVRVLAGIGTAIGLGAAFAALRTLNAAIQLDSVALLDGVAFAAGLALIIAATPLAAFLPARRATRVNPAQTLRADG